MLSLLGVKKRDNTQAEVICFTLRAFMSGAQILKKIHFPLQQQSRPHRNTQTTQSNMQTRIKDKIAYN